jgi:hypothetical protein
MRHRAFFISGVNVTDEDYISTRELAGRMHITAGTVYQRLSAKGDFWGILPVRAHNGRLLWPSDAIQALLERRMSGDGAQAA